MKKIRSHNKTRNKILFLVISGAVSTILLVIGAFKLVEFTDTTAFCGRLCHNEMRPEYTAHQASPHSNVTCAECHVGSGTSYLVKSKISGVPLIIKHIAGTYHRPIPTPVTNLRPARETCEKCHRPEKFSGDVIKVHTTYAFDEQNTKTVTKQVLRIGGGQTDISRDIHWHIQAKVWYVAMDQQRQIIGWVGIEDITSGEITSEYVKQQVADQITPQFIQKEKRLMDCIDCHNRPTHIFSSPEVLVDTAITQGRIDASLPYIKREGLKALDPPSSSLEETMTKIDKINSFYQESYAIIYQDKKDSIVKSIEVLKEIAVLTTFPEMDVTWNTYKSNIGHTDTSSGCFRCHGKLVGTSEANKDIYIDAGCTTCHYPG